MKRDLILRLFIFLLLIAQLNAADIWVTETGAGAQDGTTLANARSRSWLSTATVAAVPAGSTVRLSGTMGGFGIQFSGSAGNITTLRWEENAKISVPYSSPIIFASNRSYLCFDGGVNGIIECTDNGTDLTYQVGSSGIYGTSMHHVEIKNLAFNNLYVHTSVSDAIINEGGHAAIYIRDWSNDMAVRNCTFYNVCWAITCGTGTTTAKGLVIEDCTFTNYDHGIGGVGGIGDDSGVIIRRNNFGTTANWDTTINRYHHDGIHIFFSGAGNWLADVLIENNLFHGDWGTNNTAHIYVEGNTSDTADSTRRFVIRNNIHVGYGTNILNNGMLNLGGAGTIVENNSYIGVGEDLSFAVTTGGVGLTLRNNLFTGFNTFVTTGSGSGTTITAASNNIYAARASGGNAAFRLNLTNYNTIAAWETASGDTNSQLITDAGVDADGTLLPGSAAIGAGINLSASFTADFSGAPRPASPIAWDVGALVYERTLPYTETFEGAGLPTDFSSSTPGTAIDWDHTADPLVGAQSARVVDPGASGIAVVTVTTAPTDTLYFAFRLKPSTGTSQPNFSWIQILDAGGNSIGTVSWRSTDQKHAINAGGSDSTLNALAMDGTTQWFKIRFSKGTGANCNMWLWKSADGVAWNTAAGKSTFTATAQPSQIRFNNAANQNVSYTIDNLRVSTSDIAIGDL